MKNPWYVEFGKLGELCELGSMGVDYLCELVYLVNMGRVHEGKLGEFVELCDLSDFENSLSGWIC